MTAPRRRRGGRGAQRRSAKGNPRPASTRRQSSAPRSKRPGADSGLGGDQVEGIQAVRELLAVGRRRVGELLVAPRRESSALEELAELAAQLGVRVTDVSRDRLERAAATEAPQGVVARAEALQPASLEQVADTGQGGADPFLVVCDGVTDPGNLGALLRSAECAGATGVVLPRHRSVRITPAVTKAAAGAIEHLEIAVVAGIPAALVDLGERGVWSVGLDAGGSGTIWDLPVADEPVAVVLGSEGRGLGRLTRQRCDVVASIPLGGQLPSLNVAAAGAIACFEVSRRRSQTT